MTKALKIVGLALLGLIFIFAVMGAVNSIKNSETIEKNAKDVNQLSDSTEENTSQITQTLEIITANQKSIKKNQNSITANQNSIKRLTALQKNLQKIAWAHGAKINRTVEAIFKTAFGNSAQTSQRIQKYTENPYSQNSKKIWKQAIQSLSEKNAKKVEKLLEMEKKIISNQKKIDRLKPQAFKR